MPTKYSVIWRDDTEDEGRWHVLFQSYDRMRPWATTRRSDAEGVAQGHRLRGVEVYVVDRATVHYRVDDDQLILTSTPRILKETDTMPTVDQVNQSAAMAQLQRTIEDARSTLAHAEHQLEQLRKPPVPVQPGHDVIAFERRLGGTTYRYAARYANGRWYTTGSTCPPRGFTWPELVAFIRESERDEVYIPLTSAGIAGKL